MVSGFGLSFTCFSRLTNSLSNTSSGEIPGSNEINTRQLITCVAHPSPRISPLGVEGRGLHCYRCVMPDDTPRIRTLAGGTTSSPVGGQQQDTPNSFFPWFACLVDGLRRVSGVREILEEDHDICASLQGRRPDWTSRAGAGQSGLDLRRPIDGDRLWRHLFSRIPLRRYPLSSSCPPPSLTSPCTYRIPRLPTC